MSSASVNRSTGRTRKRCLGDVEQFLFAVPGFNRHTHHVTRLDRFLVGNKLSILREEILDVAVDVRIADLADGPLNRQAVVVGEIKLRPHFDVEFVLEIPLLRQLNCIDVQIRFVDRVEVLVRRKLLHAFQEHALLDLRRQLTPEPLFDQLRRHMPGAKPGNGDAGRLFLDTLLIEAIDLGPRNADMHMFLAGAGLLDLHRQFHPARRSAGVRTFCLAVRPGFFVRCGHASFLIVRNEKKRVKGFEPSTSTLATWCSTPELHPQTRCRHTRLRTKARALQTL